MTTIQKILNTLKVIIDPDLNKDIVSLGFVKNVQIKDTEVSFDIELTTPACPVKDEFQRKAEELVLALDGVEKVNVRLTSQQRQAPSNDEKMPSSLKDVKAIIAISSCKGGVGKSTVAAQLAQELALKGFKVGLVDADIHGPSVPTLFDLNNTPVYVNEQQLLMPIEKNGLKIMSFGFLLGDGPAVMRGPMVSRYVQQVLHQTAWGELDYLFIDMPPGTGDVQLTITQTIQLDGAVIITTPQTLSLIDVTRGILMFEKVNVPILGFIENMAYFLCDECDKKHYLFGNQAGDSLKERFGIDCLAELPLLPELSLRSNTQSPENSYISEAVNQVVRALGKQSLQNKETPKIEFNTQHVSLSWKDGSSLQVNNHDLRLSCRCALCVSEVTGEQILKEKDIKPDIAPKEVTPLGNYAIGITWNDGHSSGIYPYNSIRKIESGQNIATSL